MQATVLVGLISYTIWRDQRLKGTPLQTWPGWCVPNARLSSSPIVFSLHPIIQMLPQSHDQEPLHVHCIAPFLFRGSCVAEVRGRQAQNSEGCTALLEIIPTGMNVRPEASFMVVVAGRASACADGGRT